jgi:hypothetical protein
MRFIPSSIKKKKPAPLLPDFDISLARIFFSFHGILHTTTKTGVSSFLPLFLVTPSRFMSSSSRTDEQWPPALSLCSSSVRHSSPATKLSQNWSNITRKPKEKENDVDEKNNDESLEHGMNMSQVEFYGLFLILMTLYFWAKKLLRR